MSSVTAGQEVEREVRMCESGCPISLWISFSDVTLLLNRKWLSGKVSKLSQTLCLTSTETVRLIREGGMEVGGERDYIPIATLTSALRWTAMRAILIF